MVKWQVVEISSKTDFDYGIFSIRLANASGCALVHGLACFVVVEVLADMDGNAIDKRLSEDVL